MTGKFVYPVAPRGETVDTYQTIDRQRTVEQSGVKVNGDASVHYLRPVTVPDPYRWLEDLKCERVQNWLASENQLTEKYVAEYADRAELHDALRATFDVEARKNMQRAGGLWFFFRQTGLQAEQQELSVSRRINVRQPRTLIDPVTLAVDGHTTYLTDFVASPRGTFVAYGTSQSGSDERTWRVRCVSTGEDSELDVLPDVASLDHVCEKRLGCFSGNQSPVVWAPDEKSFFYTKVLGDEIKLFRHYLGEAPTQDRDLGYGAYPVVTADGKWLVYNWGHRAVRMFKVSDDSKWCEIVSCGGEIVFIGNVGDTFYFKTELQAAKGRVVCANLRVPNGLTEVVGEASNILQGAWVYGRRLLLSYLVDGASQLQVQDLASNAKRSFDLPALSAIEEISGAGAGNAVYCTLSGLTTPPMLMRLNLHNATGTTLYQRACGCDLTPLMSELIWCVSKDGTKLPVRLVRRRDMQLDGNNPLYMYGYGGFGVVVKPAFSPTVLPFVAAGGVIAQCVLRGGGEYGEAWHKAGMLQNKQNVFDDYIAVAEQLIERNYTRPKLLTIGGASNGGLLVGACLTQRPELFGAVAGQVGLYDMLRFVAMGGAWKEELGDPSRAREFEWLYAYSPLHHVVDGVDYPAVYLGTSLDDDRVSAAHSAKFAAALQSAQAGAAPILLRVDSEVGHNLRTASKELAEVVDRWSFILRALGLRWQNGRIRANEANAA